MSHCHIVAHSLRFQRYLTQRRQLTSIIHQVSWRCPRRRRTRDSNVPRKARILAAFARKSNRVVSLGPRSRRIVKTSRISLLGYLVSRKCVERNDTFVTPGPLLSTIVLLALARKFPPWPSPGLAISSRSERESGNACPLALPPPSGKLVSSNATTTVSCTSGGNTFQLSYCFCSREITRGVRSSATRCGYALPGYPLRGTLVIFARLFPPGLSQGFSSFPRFWLFYCLCLNSFTCLSFVSIFVRLTMSRNIQRVFFFWRFEWFRL